MNQLAPNPLAKEQIRPPVTEPGDRVPLKSKVAYGAGGMAVTFYQQLPKHLATPVLVATLGLSPSKVSYAMLLFRLYDACLDPLLGWLSDNTRSRWGRRRPFIFSGAILTGLALPVMWWVNPAWAPATQLGWFLGAGLLLYSCAALYGMPYESMNLELTPDYNERTSVTAYKACAQKVALVVVGWSWYFTQLPVFADAVTGVQDTVKGARVLSILVGLSIVAVGLMPALFVRERFYKAAAGQAKLPFWHSVRLTYRNRAFAVLASLTVFFASAYYLSDAMQFYLRLYYVTGGDQALAAKIRGVELTLTMILAIISIPCFSWLSRQIGKTWTLMTAMGITLVALGIKWWIYNPAYPWLSMATPILMAPSLTGIWQMVPSMTGDIVDDDEIATGARREGAFASMYSWIAKAAFTAGLVLAGPLVEWCGFQVELGSAQTAETILHMRLTDAILPVALLATAMVILCYYPLSPLRVRQTRAELERRRGAI